MGHPRTIRMKADMVDKIDYTKVMEMYKNEVIIVGHIKV